jgi:hypothetical protein
MKRLAQRTQSGPGGIQPQTGSERSARVLAIFYTTNDTLAYVDQPDLFRSSMKGSGHEETLKGEQA